MIEWNDTHKTIRDMMRRFVEAEIVPHREALEHGDMPPYGVLRKPFEPADVVKLVGSRLHQLSVAQGAQAITLR